MHIDWIPFRVVALTLHLGSDRAGHYRSVLKVHPDCVDPQQSMMYFTSLITDDWTPPMRSWREHTWISTHVHCVWLGRCSEVNLPSLTVVPDATPDSPRAAPVRGPPVVTSMDMLRMFGDDSDT